MPECVLNQHHGMWLGHKRGEGISHSTCCSMLEDVSMFGTHMIRMTHAIDMT